MEEEDRLRTTSMNVAAEMAIGNITFRGTGRKISMQRTEIRQQQSRQTPQHANGRGKPQLPPPPPVVSNQIDIDIIKAKNITDINSRYPIFVRKRSNDKKI